MKRVLFTITIIISVSCTHIKPMSNLEGTYCYYNGKPLGSLYSKEGVPSIVLRINPDDTYEVFDTYDVYNNGLYTTEINNTKGKIISQKNKLKLVSLYPKSYHIETIKERDDDSTFIYCYYSSYEIIDTVTTFRILNKNDEVIKDYFETDAGVIKLLPESKDWYLDVVPLSCLGLSGKTKILRLEKGKEYILSLICDWLENNKYEFIKSNDTSYFLIQKTKNFSDTYGDLKFPMVKCNFDTAMNQIMNWQYRHY